MNGKGCLNLGSSCAVGANLPHTGCTCPKQFSHESMSTCARRNYWWGEENLDVICQTYAKFTYHTSTRFSCSSRSTTIFPVALHGARRARHRVDVAASGSGRGAGIKKRRGNRDLVKPSKTAPRIWGRNKATSNRYILMKLSGPKRWNPLFWVYLPRLFDHIWLFLLPISRVIIFQCARVHTRGSQGEAKKRGRTEYSVDIYFSRWRYGCLNI